MILGVGDDGEVDRLLVAHDARNHILLPALERPLESGTRPVAVLSARDLDADELGDQAEETGERLLVVESVVCHGWILRLAPCSDSPPTLRDEMLLFFDESGDFGFPDDRFDAYTQAVVICPDSKMPELEEWAAAKRDEWGVEEFHATELTDDQVWEVCRAMRTRGIPALVQATDTNVASLKDIEQHRLTQAVRLHENMETWRAGGGQGEAIPAWYEQMVKASAYAGRVSHAEWLQANMIVDLFHRGINKAVGFHHDDKYRPDFEEFRFILDRKLPGKLASGEKHLDQVLLGYLASNPHRSI